MKKQRDKQVRLTEDLPEWLIERIAAREMDAKFDYLDKVPEDRAPSYRKLRFAV